MANSKLCHLGLWLEPSIGVAIAPVVENLLEEWSPRSHDMLRYIDVIGLLVLGFGLFH